MSMLSPSVTPSLPALGILAGKGELPRKIIEQCRSQGRDFYVLAFEGNATVDDYANLPHSIIRLGAVGEGLEILKKAGVKDVVMAGNIKRPTLASFRPDATATRLIKKLGRAVFSGDDALLKALISFLEEEGFRVVGVESLIGGLLARAGNIGKLKPSAEQIEQIEAAMKTARAIGQLDIGQAIVIESGYVLGVEAAEGTDALIARCKEVMRTPGTAILIKAKKPNQEARADMPTIGTTTIEALAANGYAGIAVEANATLIVDGDKTRETADRLGIFIYGVAGV